MNTKCWICQSTMGKKDGKFKGLHKHLSKKSPLMVLCGTQSYCLHLAQQAILIICHQPDVCLCVQHTCVSVVCGLLQFPHKCNLSCNQKFTLFLFTASSIKSTWGCWTPLADPSDLSQKTKVLGWKVIPWKITKRKKLINVSNLDEWAKECLRTGKHDEATAGSSY